MRILPPLLAIILGLIISIGSKASNPTDSLSKILKSRASKEQQQQQIIRLSYDYFLRSSKFDQQVKSTIDSLKKYELDGQQELHNFINVLILRRKNEFEKAEQLLGKSISMALEHNEKVFLWQFYLNQAYVQTDLGNSLNAVHHYRLARKVAEELNNSDFFTITDIGISDIYMNIGLYPQALIYLEQAQQTYNEKKINRLALQSSIYLNKAEIYFKIGNLDSLKHYMSKIEKVASAMPDVKWYITRFKYFKLILEKRYDLAIPIIQELLAMGNPYYRKVDLWHLAECYYHTGKVDLAQSTATELAEDPKPNFSQIKIDSYKLLAKILEEKNQLKQANVFLTLAVNESATYAQRISKVGDVASELRQDHIEASYEARNLIYKKERIILVMAIVLAILGLIVIFASYINIKQKSRFQKLLHQARSKELAFINSHQVRKPLANILGICHLLDGQQTKPLEINEYIKLIQAEAKEMDEKLTDVERKLNAQASASAN